MKAPFRGDRFAVVTNIPTPYRTVFFNEVARACSGRDAAFKVFYCAKTEKNRNWPFEPAKMDHPFEILPGFHVTLGEATHHFNPSVLGRLAAYRPTVVVCAGSWHMSATVLTSLGSIGDRFRTVFWSEGHAEAVHHTLGLIAWLRRKALSLHYAFAVPNRRSADWIRTQVGGRPPLLTLPNTVDGIFFTRRSLDERRAARIALSIAPDETVILQISQLTKRKGVIPLAQAFSALSDSVARSARLVFVGAGPLEPKLRSIASASSGRVLVAGSVPIDGVRTWLMAADWFALNSSFDPNPLSPIEASFAALPLLLTRQVGNFEELLPSDKIGFEIADTADPSTALIQALTTPPDRTKQMGEAAFANVMKNFGVRQIAVNFVEDLSRLDGTSKSG